MAKNGVVGKFSVHRLPVMEPPLPTSGGRIVNDKGELAQIIADETIQHVAYQDFPVDGTPRGNHYHIERKMHGIYIIKGRVHATLVDIDDESRAAVVLEAGDFIRIKSRCAHVFVAQEYSQSIELNDTPFDPADTYPYVIKEPTAQEA